MGLRDLAVGVRAAGGLGGVRDGPARQWCRRAIAAHRVVAWVAASAALYACAVMAASTRQHDAWSPAGVTIATLVYVIFAVIPIVRWPPWLPVAVTTAGAVASMATGTPDVLIGPALVVAVLVFSLRSEKTPVIAGTATVIGVLLAGHLAFSLHAKAGWSDLAVVPWAAVAAAIGQAVRAKRAHQVMLEERARRAEEGREHEARRRVQQERLRIARELHDAVGHHVALISVQAGAMGYLLDTDPAKARESLAHIQRASEAALEELRLTVGLLRQPGEHEPVEPAGGLARLDELIASFAATGLQVTCDVTGQVRQLPEAVDLTAYRLIQESLTNTAKHAAGTSASVKLAFRPGALELAVEDDGPPSGGSQIGDEGHGIIGMRERAAALGGWLSAGRRAGGGFRVLAELPAPARRSAMTAVRVLLADDQELVRAGLRMMVDSAPDLTVVAEAATGRQAVRLAREARADVVLMDIRMPELDGLAATRQITADEDLAGVKVLILTTFEVDDYVFEALRSGASGFLGKGSRPDVLIDAIRTVARGDALLSPAATRGLIARFLALHDPGPAAAPSLLEALTDREREIVALVATGMSNAEIAEHLTLSPLTVKTHANHAMTKLGARDRAQLVVLAYQAGLPGPSPAPASA